MRFDLVYKEIGEFGLFQKYVVLVVHMTLVYTGFLYLNTVFVLAIPDHRCAIPGLANDTYTIQNDHHRYLINVSIPQSDDDDTLYDQCHVYVPTSGDQQERQKCDRWVYDKSIFKSTLAADMNMVCDQVIMKSSVQMALFGGLLAGSFFTGMFSDRFGRKTTICISSFFMFVAAMAIALVNSYSLLVFLTFSTGFFSAGSFLPSHVLSMEIVGPSKRRFAGTMHTLMWALGNAILAGLGYAIRDWQMLQIACALPGVLLQLFWFEKIMIESPRWLYSQGRKQEAEKVINRAARIAKVKLPDGFYDKVFVDSETIPQGKIWHLFMSKTLCVRTLVIFYIWIVVSLAYYGLALNSVDIGGDLYLNFFLSMIMDLPATIAVILLVDRTGRKPLMMATLLISGSCCLVTVFTIAYGGKAYQMVTNAFSMIGKCGASGAFSMVYICSAELFPTVVRNSGLGSSSCISRVGAMVAPFIADLDRLIGGPLGKAMPQLVFGIMSIVAGVLAILLPETLNRSLPETIQDGENIGRKAITDKESAKHPDAAMELI